MARQEELVIEISPAGELRVEVKGAGGKRCLDYLEVFQRLLGPVREQHLTPEYYEAEMQAQAQQKLHRR
jgi:Protein of unknown function (DUF2997)